MSATPASPSLAPLTARGLVRSYGDRTVLDGLDLTVPPGTRLALIGENGSGKSTLLRLLAGLERPDAGTVVRPRDLVHLAQEPAAGRGGAAPGGTVGDLLDDALRPLHDLVAELERLAARMAAEDVTPELGAAYDAVLARATHHDAWDADRRATVTAGVLGVADLDRERPVAALSGGQRTRLALAAALVRRPDCLLLDEPTNHLDAEALELLEGALAQLPGVVVAASHDRTFLDRVCTSLLDLDAGALGTDGAGGRVFGGSFTDYLAHQQAARRRWEETWAAQQQEIAELRAATRIGTTAVARDRGPRDNDKFIHAFKGARVERTHARRVRDAERRLEVAEREALPKPRPPLRFAGALTAGSDGDGPVVRARGIDVPGRLALDRLDVAAGASLLVTGPNGCGKSTLLAVLAGELPAGGALDVRARTVRLLRQDPEVTHPRRTARAAYLAAVGPALAERVPLRALGLLPPRAHATPVGALSVGQRRRLDLAIAIAAAPDLLLLDEPTNHLSLGLAGELEEAVGTTPGTVVVTTHDRWLRARWTGEELALTGPR